MRSRDPKEIDMRPYVIKTRSGPRPLVWVIGIAVAAFCVTGIAVIMEPAATEFVASAENDRAAGASAPVGAVANKTSCDTCGVVESVKGSERLAQSSGLPAIGAMAAGNEIEKQSSTARNYEITVRMDDGAVRVIRETGPLRWRAGDHIKIVDRVMVMDLGG